MWQLGGLGGKQKKAMWQEGYRAFWRGWGPRTCSLCGTMFVVPAVRDAILGHNYAACAQEGKERQLFSVN